MGLSGMGFSGDRKAGRGSRGVAPRGVWNPRVKGLGCMRVLTVMNAKSVAKDGSTRDTPFSISTHPECEAARLKESRSLRSKLHRMCSAAGVKVPVLAFERWLARWALEGEELGKGCPLLPSQTKESETQGLTSDAARDGPADLHAEKGDAMLPSDRSGAHQKGLENDLIRAGMTDKQAAQAAQELGKASVEACARVRGCLVGGRQKEVSIDMKGGVTRLSLGGKDVKPYLQV